MIMKMVIIVLHIHRFASGCIHYFEIILFGLDILILDSFIQPHLLEDIRILVFVECACYAHCMIEYNRI